MIDYAGRNGLSADELENLLTSGRTYNAYTYDNETDNYQQDHYQLHYAYQFNRKWNMKAAAHYTRGRGYYENRSEEHTSELQSRPHLVCRLLLEKKKKKKKIH